MRAAIAVAAALVAAPVAAAPCQRPAAPPIPDGAAASNAQMAEALQGMERFQQDMNAYLACLDAEYTDAKRAGEAALGRWNQEVDKHRAAE